jgi:hypothetical protein
MTASDLLAELERQGVSVTVERGDLRVVARKGLLTPELRQAIALAKPELVATLRAKGAGPFGSLIEYAASLLPTIRLTIRETGDTARDFDLVGRLRGAIREFQPGGNHIYLTIVTRDRRRVVVEWRALADRELRIALGRLLARTAVRERISRQRRAKVA